MNRIKKQSCAFSEQQCFRTAVVLLSAWLQTAIGPPENSCSWGGGTFDNLSATCSCSQVKPQQRKCPGCRRKQLPTAAELLHGLTILHQKPGRPQCSLCSALLDTNRKASSGPLSLPLSPFSASRFSGWSRGMDEPHRFDAWLSRLHLWFIRLKHGSRAL